MRKTTSFRLSVQYTSGAHILLYGTMFLSGVITRCVLTAILTAVLTAPSSTTIGRPYLRRAPSFLARHRQRSVFVSASTNTDKRCIPSSPKRCLRCLLVTSSSGCYAGVNFFSCTGTTALARHCWWSFPLYASYFHRLNTWSSLVAQTEGSTSKMPPPEEAVLADERERHGADLEEFRGC